MIQLRVTEIVKVSFKGWEKLPDCNFIFKLKLSDIFTHFVNLIMKAIEVKNTGDSVMRIDVRTHLGSLVDYDEMNCYNAVLEEIIKCNAEANDVMSDETEQNLSDKETKLVNDITVYRTSEKVKDVMRVIDDYLTIWTDFRNTVNLSDDEHMTILLINDWMSSEVKLSHCIYSLKLKSWALIDEKFDKLHDEGKMTWINASTQFGFSVFIVWKTVFMNLKKVSTKKRWVMMNIWGLNKIAINDAYPLPLQSDIIAAVQGSSHISTVDRMNFFHQFLVSSSDRQKLTVISHRGQKQSNVILMSYKESSLYIQRKMNQILWLYWTFAHCYIDDIMIFFRSFKEHVKHLWTIFDLFTCLIISLKSRKFYLSYLSVTLLSQRVNGLDLLTAEEKVAALKGLAFLITLKALKTYLRLTEWLQHYMPYYMQITESLQARKTELLWESSVKEGNACKAFTFRMKLIPIKMKRQSFEILQRSWENLSFLHHFDSIMQLYMNVNTFKQYEYRSMLYHVKGNLMNNNFSRSNILSILFLSKMLNRVKRNYWLTELKIAELVWMIRKTQHLIEASAKLIIIFTDHSVIMSIVKQMSLSSSVTDKLNLRLIQASQYLSQFCLNVHHRLRKQHVISDALFRLLNESVIIREDAESEEGTLDEVFMLTVSLIELSDDFRKEIKESYQKDWQWKKVFKMLEKAEDISKGSWFLLKDGLIHYWDAVDERLRLCVSKALEGDIFLLTHDNKSHISFHHIYETLTANLYFRNMSKHLKKYIEHCKICQLNQTKWHKEYDILTLIEMLSIPFHTVVMNFVIDLPLIQGFNALLSITDKHSKCVTLLSGKDTHTAEDWAKTLLNELTDWGLSQTIISDHDLKFLSEFWKMTFKRLGIRKMLLSTAYHLQTDGQSERINQTAEIALRYYLTEHPDGDWVEFLPELWATLNNMSNSSTGLFSNEVIYRFKLCDTLSSLTTDVLMNFTLNRAAKSKEAEESLAFTQLSFKIQYDWHHCLLAMKVENLVYIHLHWGYSLPGLKNRKFANQKTGSFSIKRKIESLAYELKLSEEWKIHSVIFITQLKSTLKGGDLYKRLSLNHSSSVVKRDNFYELKWLLSKRTWRYEQGKPWTEYLVKWKGYEPEFRKWYSLN